MKKTLYTKLTLAALSLQVLAGSAIAKDLPIIIKPFRSPQTFCEVNRFTGEKRQFTVKTWDESTQFDVVIGMEEGDIVDIPCSKIETIPSAYCFEETKTCWIEYDISIDGQLNAEIQADLVEGAQE